MALVAAEKAVEMAGIESKQIDMVICATYTSDLVFPSTACLLQAKMDLSNAAAFDIEAACCGFIYGLTIGSNFIESGMSERVLVIGADASSRVVDWTDRNTCVLFGDGSAAVVLERRPFDGDASKRRGLLSSYLKADGRGWTQLHQPAGGSLAPPSVETVEKKLHHIRMKGREIFKVAGRAMAEAGRAAVEQGWPDHRRLDLVVPHQANSGIIHNFGSRGFQVPEDR